MTQVILYTRKFCGFCMLAKRLLANKGVEYAERDATFDPDMRAEMIERAGGASTFPQIFVNGEHIGGFTELQALDQRGGLDAMLAGKAPT